MTSMRRHYIASTSLRRHVPAGNLPPPCTPPPPPPQYSKPWAPQYSKPSYANAVDRWKTGEQQVIGVKFVVIGSLKKPILCNWGGISCSEIVCKKVLGALNRLLSCCVIYQTADLGHHYVKCHTILLTFISLSCQKKIQ